MFVGVPPGVPGLAVAVVDPADTGTCITAVALAGVMTTGALIAAF